MFWVGHQSLQEQPEPPAEMLPNTGKAFPGDLHHCFIKTTQLDRATGCVHADTYTWEEQPAWHGRKQPRAPRDPSEQNRRDGTQTSCNYQQLLLRQPGSFPLPGVFGHICCLCQGKGKIKSRKTRARAATLVFCAICQCNPRPSQQARAAPNLKMETLGSIRTEKPSWRHGSD